MRRGFGLWALLAVACGHVEAAPTAPLAKPPPSASAAPVTQPTPEGVRLTRPASSAEAWVEELGYLEHLLDLWWASRDEHRRLDKLDAAPVFAAARERARSCGALACYADVVRRALCALGDGHLRLEPEWWLPQKRFRSAARSEPGATPRSRRPCARSELGRQRPNPRKRRRLASAATANPCPGS